MYSLIGAMIVGRIAVVSAVRRRDSVDESLDIIILRF